jgi:hypothetical protein
MPVLRARGLLREEVAVNTIDKLRRDAPFIGIVFAILLTALALAIATISLLARG